MSLVFSSLSHPSRCFHRASISRRVSLGKSASYVERQTYRHWESRKEKSWKGCGTTLRNEREIDRWREWWLWVHTEATWIIAGSSPKNNSRGRGTVVKRELKTVKMFLSCKIMLIPWTKRFFFIFDFFLRVLLIYRVGVPVIRIELRDTLSLSLSFCVGVPGFLKAALTDIDDPSCRSCGCTRWLKTFQLRLTERECDVVYGRPRLFSSRRLGRRINLSASRKMNGNWARARMKQERQLDRW